MFGVGCDCSGRVDWTDPRDAEIARLTACLKRANESLEETERDLYLQIQALEDEVLRLKTEAQRNGIVRSDNPSEERAALVVELTRLDVTIQAEKCPAWKVDGLSRDKQANYSAMCRRKKWIGARIAELNIMLRKQHDERQHPTGDDRRHHIMAVTLYNAASIVERCRSIDEAVAALHDEAIHADPTLVPKRATP